MTTTREDRTSQIQTIASELETKIANLVSSADWMRALDVASRFHHYSLNNILWLSMQADERGIELTQVAGFRAWQKLGRNVRQGETALKVLAPSRYKRTDDATGEDRWVVRGFTLASVFDIAQTDGHNLPSVRPALLNGSDAACSALLASIVVQIREAAFDFSYATPTELKGRQWSDALGTAARASSRRRWHQSSVEDGRP